MTAVVSTGSSEAMRSAILLSMLLATVPDSAGAFGTVGHRVAERVAEPLLCSSAAAAIARFGDGPSLVGLGAWADRIRYVPTWEFTAPWHYINVRDGESIDARDSSSNDVLWAIGHFATVLGDSGSPDPTRAAALRFLVHFIVDIHQPLHVGRSEDRGGNAISVVVDGETTNLHQLWDSGALVRGRHDENAHVAAAQALARSAGRRWLASTPAEWAEESKALRSVVYGYDAAPGEAYLENAHRVLERRLAQAGVRLAAKLNHIFCGAGADRASAQ